MATVQSYPREGQQTATAKVNVQTAQVSVSVVRFSPTKEFLGNS